MLAPLIENDIRALLDAPSSGRQAPTLAAIEEALTTGYARAMALEAEQTRLQRRIAEVVVGLADEDDELPDPALKRLAQELKAADAELGELRQLLGSLRRRADATRAAV
jgi:hypothetical protein